MVAKVSIVQNFVLFEENKKQHCVRTDPSQVRSKTLPQAEEAFLSNGCSQNVLLTMAPLLWGKGGKGKAYNCSRILWDSIYRSHVLYSEGRCISEVPAQSRQINHSNGTMHFSCCTWSLLCQLALKQLL